MASRYLQQAKEQESNNVWIHIEFAKTYGKEGNLSMMLEAAEKAVGLGSGQPQAHVVLGEALVEVGKNDPESVVQVKCGFIHLLKALECELLPEIRAEV